MTELRKHILNLAAKLQPPFHLKHWKWVRLAIFLCLDSLILGLSFRASFILRLDDFSLQAFSGTFFFYCFPVIVCYLLAFWLVGVYRQVWRFANLKSAMIIGYGTLAGWFVFLLVSTAIKFDPALPRSIAFIQAPLVLAFVTGSRFSWRAWINYITEKNQSEKPVAVIYGAGAAGEMLLRSSRTSFNFPYRIVGFVDDDPNMRRRVVQGCVIFGGLDCLEKLKNFQKVDTVIVALHSVKGEVIRKIFRRCLEIGLNPLMLPQLGDSLHTDILRPRPVSLDDLLGRDPKNIDFSAIRTYLTEKVVLITGAGGSIGSEICRQVLKNNPTKVVILDMSEYNLYNIEQQLQQLRSSSKVRVVPVLGSLENKTLVEKVFIDHSPAIVIHAAAYKHVPIIEENVCVGVLNNVKGTWNLLEQVVVHNVESFLLVSTDKAVNPTNVMGATKRCCELLVQHFAHRHSGVKFVTVRFGNVLGSSGSVIPKFMEQIRSGGPVTVTHPDVTRYFMLTEEAVGLVLQSAAMANGGETFVLNMGEPVNIMQMAINLIYLAGKLPHEDIEIEIVGLRPGEKLHEELFLNNTESTVVHEDVLIAQYERIDENEIVDSLKELCHLALKGNSEGVRTILEKVARLRLEDHSNDLETKTTVTRNFTENRANL